LVLLDAPLPDHEFSDEVMDYAREEERLLATGEFDGAVELNLDFWAPTIADLVRPMVADSLSRVDAERIARELPDAELAVIPGAGHLPSMERPEATGQLVGGFLERKHNL